MSRTIFNILTELRTQAIGDKQLRALEARFDKKLLESEYKDLDEERKSDSRIDLKCDELRKALSSRTRLDDAFAQVAFLWRAKGFFYFAILDAFITLTFIQSPKQQARLNHLIAEWWMRLGHLSDTYHVALTSIQQDPQNKRGYIVLIQSLIKRIDAESIKSDRVTMKEQQLYDEARDTFFKLLALDEHDTHIPQFRDKLRIIDYGSDGDDIEVNLSELGESEHSEAAQCSPPDPKKMASGKVPNLFKSNTCRGLIVETKQLLDAEIKDDKQIELNLSKIEGKIDKNTFLPDIIEIARLYARLHRYLKMIDILKQRSLLRPTLLSTAVSSLLTECIQNMPRLIDTPPVYSVEHLYVAVYLHCLLEKFTQAKQIIAAFKNHHAVLISQENYKEAIEEAEMVFEQLCGDLPKDAVPVELGF